MTVVSQNAAVYKGFSTVSSDAQKKFVLTDRKLIKQDLINALNIRPGSVVMQPTVGCIVWQMLFEQLTQTAMNDIAANITSIVNNDVRLNLQKLDVSQNQNSIIITMTLLYVNTNEVEQMVVNFSGQTQSASYY